MHHLGVAVTSQEIVFIFTSRLVGGSTNTSYRYKANTRYRPDYRQNNYIGVDHRAKREDTRQKRLAQMLVELEKGDVYMKMDCKKK